MTRTGALPQREREIVLAAEFSGIGADLPDRPAEGAVGRDVVARHDLEGSRDWRVPSAAQLLARWRRRACRGVICGVRIEEIDDPLMREIRILNKMIDELAKGRAMEKILRQPPEK